jgi:hypothetical protein
MATSCAACSATWKRTSMFGRRRRHVSRRQRAAPARCAADPAADCPSRRPTEYRRRGHLATAALLRYVILCGRTPRAPGCARRRAAMGLHPIRHH